MTRLCERPGCSAPAAVAYGFEAEHRAVWLDHLTAPGAARAGALCRRHADAMVVPIGWSLDDRREMVPRLFPPRRRRAADPEPEGAEALAGGGPAHPPSRREARPRRSRSRPDDTGQLAFDALVPAPDALGTASPDALDAASPEVPADEPSDVPADEPSDVPAEVSTDGRSEALAPNGADAAPAGRPDAEPIDPTSPLDRPATPWQPVFDQRDDLDGLLAPRSSLLSRAFRGTPRPPS